MKKSFHFINSNYYNQYSKISTPIYMLYLEETKLDKKTIVHIVESKAYKVHFFVKNIDKSLNNYVNERIFVTNQCIYSIDFVIITIFTFIIMDNKYLQQKF